MQRYDVLVIGAGIIGSAMAWELSKYEGKFAVVEAAPDVGTGTTKGTGGLIHAGYDPHPGTLKALLNVRGCLMYEELSREVGFPYQKTGALVVGFNQEDEKYLEMLLERGARNCVPGLEILHGHRIFELEPAVNPNAICALYSPHTGISDPYETAIALAESAGLNGVDFYFNSQVSRISKSGNGFTVRAGTHTLYANRLINAAGCAADTVAGMAGDTGFAVRCRHGDLLIFDKNCEVRLGMPLYPIPNETSKGIAVVPTISGNISVGSTSVFREKGDLQTYADGVKTLVEQSILLVPHLNMKKIIRPYAGLRAVVDTSENDFYIKESQTVCGLFHLAGIQSPGVSSAPAIAQYMMELLESSGLKLAGKDSALRVGREIPPDTSTMDNAALAELIAKNPDYGEVICRCEFVTKGEILNAIRAKPFGATTVDGVKRRTRAGMGRCQGGFCQHRVVELISRELGLAPEEIRKEKAGSELLVGPVKGETP